MTLKKSLTVPVAVAAWLACHSLAVAGNKNCAQPSARTMAVQSSAPIVTYAAPAVAYSAPAVAYAAPVVTYSAPATTYYTPAATQSAYLYSAPLFYAALATPTASASASQQGAAAGTNVMQEIRDELKVLVAAVENCKKGKVDASQSSTVKTPGSETFPDAESGTPTDVPPAPEGDTPDDSKLATSVTGLTSEVNTLNQKMDKLTEAINNLAAARSRKKK